MRKKVLSMVLVLCMVLTMMPYPTMAVGENDYNIWVSGIKVTSENKDNITGDGTVSYAPDTHTLTLNNTYIVAAYEDNFWHDKICIYSDINSPLILNLIGENFITGVDSIRSTYGIKCNSKLIIAGEGSLTVTPGKAYISTEYGNNDSTGIFTYGGLIINDVTLNIEGEKYGLCEWVGNIIINGGTVTAYGSNCAIRGNLISNGKKVSVVVGDVEPYEEWDGNTNLSSNYKYVKIELDPYFITDIAMTNATSVHVNTDLILEGTVSSDTNTNHTITWSVEDANGTGATINDGIFKATSEGTAKVKASAKNGLTVSDNFTKTFDITVTAVATVVTNTITATAITGGSISPSGSVTVNNGESQTFTITPNRNYSIDDVKVDGVSQGHISTYTFSNITGDHTISATFKYNGSDKNTPSKNTPSKNTSSTDDVGNIEETPVFVDIANHWAKKDIEFAVSRKLLIGTSDITFSPDTAMTRGMFVTVLGRLANVNVDSYNESSFNDVKSDAYYMGYIEWANKNNIVKGIGDGNFAPEQAITREQMAVIMSNYIKTMDIKLPQTDVENTFVDSDKISTYAMAAVKQMQMAGIISGKNGNIFDPQGTSTRGEVSAVLHRLMELIGSGDTM